MSDTEKGIIIPSFDILLAEAKTPNLQSSCQPHVWVILQTFADQKTTPMSQFAFPFALHKPNAITSENITLIQRTLKDKLHQISGTPNLIVLYVVFAAQSGMENIAHLQLKSHKPWLKSAKKVSYCSDLSAFEDCINRVLENSIAKLNDTKALSPTKAAISSLALLNGKSIIELDAWKGSKIITEKCHSLDTWNHAPHDRPACGNLLMSVSIDAPLRLRIHAHQGAQTMRKFSKVPPVYAWLEDPFGRNVQDIARFPSVEVISARPHGNGIHGTKRLHFRKGSSCVVFEDLSVSSTGEYLLFFFCKPALDTLAPRLSLMIDSPILSANMPPFHVIS